MPGPMAPLRWRNTISPSRAIARTIAVTITHRGVPLGAPWSGPLRAPSTSSGERRGSAMSVSSCRAGWNALPRYRDTLSLSNHGVSRLVIAYTRLRAEPVDRDDRDPPPRGARRDPGHRRHAGSRARTAGRDDVPDRRRDRDRTSNAVQVLPRRRGDPARLARSSGRRASHLPLGDPGPGDGCPRAARSRAGSLRPPVPSLPWTPGRRVRRAAASRRPDGEGAAAGP